MCCQVEVSATSWSLAQRSPTDCGASCVWSRKPRERGGYNPRWAAGPYEKKIQATTDPEGSRWLCLPECLYNRNMKVVTLADVRTGRFYPPKISLVFISVGGRDSSVGIATRYGLDSPGIESRWGRDFPHPSRPALGPIHLLYNWYRDFLGGKAVGAWRWPPTLI
jgi:hypothetical protein